MKDVIIEISSCIEAEDTQTVTVNTVGQMHWENEVCQLFYDETDEDGDVTQTRIRIEPDSVTIHRTGKTGSCLTIRPGERYLSQYDMAFGSFCVGISGKTVHSAMDENGGLVRLEYSVDADSEFLSNNKIEITVRRSFSDV